MLEDEKELERNVYFFETTLGVIGIANNGNEIIEVFLNKEKREGYLIK